VLKELANDCWSHEPCQDVQDGEVAYYCWAVYISGGARISAKGGVNGGLTMVNPGAVMRACCYERRCSYCPPPSWSQTRVYVDGPDPKIVEGGPRRQG
jgi:hypothetical protein